MRFRVLAYGGRVSHSFYFSCLDAAKAWAADITGECDDLGWLCADILDRVTGSHIGTWTEGKQILQPALF